MSTREYTSRYAHFSRFAAGMRKGKTVKRETWWVMSANRLPTGPICTSSSCATGKINFLGLRLPKNDVWREDLHASNAAHEREALPQR
jgi:hypothetical protein